MTSARAFCSAILESGALADKLRPPPIELDFADAARPPTLRPARDPGIALVEGGGGRLPKLGALGDPKARADCLSKFAHHELCAVELFAWAVLAFPDMPRPLARALVATLAEEQLHCALYIERLRAHGVEFGALPLSDYFWRHIDKMTSPLAFLCAMGLTLEQANLDFTLMYRDAFSRAGDLETAAVIQRVHDDEIGHVKLAAVWVKKLAEADDDLHAYRAHAPFPFSLARAKGRRFDAAARKRAALSDDMIEAVRIAKPYSAPS